MKLSRVAVPLLLCAALGCVEGKTPRERFHSRMRADPAELSTFLPNHDLLEKQPNTFPFHYFYLKDNGKHYDRVYVAPVDTSVLRESNSWEKFDEAMSGKLGSSVDDLAEFMQKAYEQAFRECAASSHLEVVSAPSPKRGTLVIETAIVACRLTKAELSAAGMAVNVLVFPGLGFAVSALGSGSITVECRIRDAETGEIISMNATTETDPKALIGTAQFTWANSARLNIKQIAAYTAQVYLAANDYAKVNRKFPLSWTALIKDADLDEDE